MRNAARGIVVRGGKGWRERRAMLPATAKASLVSHLEVVREQYAEEANRGAGSVELPGALGAGYRGVGRSWAWRWALPATRGHEDCGTRQLRRLRAAEPA